MDADGEPFSLQTTPEEFYPWSRGCRAWLDEVNGRLTNSVEETQDGNNESAIPAGDQVVENLGQQQIRGEVEDVTGRGPISGLDPLPHEWKRVFWIEPF